MDSLEAELTIEKIVGRAFTYRDVPSGQEICEAQLLSMIERMKKVDLNTKQIEPAMLAHSAEQAGNTGSDDEKSSVEPDTAGDRD